MQSWPSAPCAIRHCEVEEVQKQQQTTYVPKVEYEYTVNGESFVGSRLCLNDFACGTREEADAKLAPFRDTKEPRVFYDPDKPEWSILNPTWQREADIVVFVFLGLWIAGSGVWLAIEIAR